jgi:hypothetical protein
MEPDVSGAHTANSIRGRPADLSCRLSLRTDKERGDFR